MIYKSFIRKKTTKIYFLLFIIFSLVFAFLTISRTLIIKKGNEAYQNSYIYFSSNEDIDLSKEENIKKYNKALYASDCSNNLVNIFVVKETPIINNNNQDKSTCTIDDITINYNIINSINIIENQDLYELLEKEQTDYYYFISLKNWFKVQDTVKELNSKFNIDIYSEEHKIDDNNYKNIIFIFELFIKILFILFVIIVIISIINIIIDERKINKLYYSLGFSKVNIIIITLNKILLIILIPIILFSISFIYNYFFFK